MNEPGSITYVDKLPDPQPCTISEPTVNLRFVERLGVRVLQQCWSHTHYDARGLPVAGNHEWRDVPLEEEADLVSPIEVSW